MVNHTEPERNYRPCASLYGASEMLCFYKLNARRFTSKKSSIDFTAILPCCSALELKHQYLEVPVQYLCQLWYTNRDTKRKEAMHKETHRYSV